MYTVDSEGMKKTIEKAVKEYVDKQVAVFTQEYTSRYKVELDALLLRTSIEVTGRLQTTLVRTPLGPEVRVVLHIVENK